MLLFVVNSNNIYSQTLSKIYEQRIKEISTQSDTVYSLIKNCSRCYPNAPVFAMFIYERRGKYYFEYYYSNKKEQLIKKRFKIARKQIALLNIFLIKKQKFEK